MLRRVAAVLLGLAHDPDQIGQGVHVSPLQVRPVGGALGCLAMVFVSVVLSVLLTVGLNLLLR